MVLAAQRGASDECARRDRTAMACDATDVVQTKSRVGQLILGTSFRSDVDANGAINATDTSSSKRTSVPACPNDY